MPAAGGWFILSSGILLVAGLIYETRIKKHIMKTSTAALPLLLMIFMTSCSKSPEKIVLGQDMCDDCKMTISDDRFGAVLHTSKGRTYKFDDTNCLQNYMKNHADEKGDVYLVNYCEPHDLAPLSKTMLWSSADLQSPMNGNIAAFTNKDSINLYSQHFPGKNIDAQTLLQ
jgi:copper chaperone NosL